MPRVKRTEICAEDEVQAFHLINRCVRRTFLWAATAGAIRTDFDHWVACGAVSCDTGPFRLKGFCIARRTLEPPQLTKAQGVLWLSITFRRPRAGGRDNWQLQKQPAGLRSPSGSSGRKLRMESIHGPCLSIAGSAWTSRTETPTTASFRLVATSYGPAGTRPTEAWWIDKHSQGSLSTLWLPAPCWLARHERKF